MTRPGSGDGTIVIWKREWNALFGKTLIFDSSSECFYLETRSRAAVGLRDLGWPPSDPWRFQQFFLWQCFLWFTSAHQSFQKQAKTPPFGRRGGWKVTFKLAVVINRPEKRMKIKNVAAKLLNDVRDLSLLKWPYAPFWIDVEGLFCSSLSSGFCCCGIA